MRISVVTFSGRELAVLDAEPGWQAPALLAALGEAPQERRLFLGDVELCCGATLAGLGAGDGAVLTLVQCQEQRVVTGDEGGAVQLWSLSTGKKLRELPRSRRGVLQLAFSPDGKELAVASEAGTSVLAMDSGERTLELPGDLSACFSPDGGTVLTTNCDGSVNLFREGRRVAMLRNEDAVSFAAFAPDGGRLVTACEDCHAKIWDVASRRCLHALRCGDRVQAAAFSPDGMQVATGGADASAKLWSAASGECLRNLLGHTDLVCSLAFSPDGSQLLTSSWDSTAKLWSTASGECLRTLRGHEDYVLTARFSPDGAQVLTASVDGTAKTWDAASGRCLRTLQGRASMRAAAFCPAA